MFFLETAMTAVVYPGAIARACSALDEAPLFRDLPDGYLRVMIRIIKKINLARLTAPIVASRATLARESGKSVETVHRVVKWLEERGLVQRSQKARAGLRGSSSPLVPTPALLDALQLINAPASPYDKARQSANASLAPSAHGSEKKEAATPPATKPSASSAGAFVQFEGMKLPADLAWLVKEQGLKASGVLDLMKRARLAQQRLSDVVASTRQYLQGLQGRALYAYLRALLGKGRDFADKVVEKVGELKEQEQREYLRHKAQALAGRQFTNREGSVHVLVEESGMLIETREGRRGARPMCQSFLDAIEAGRLVPVREGDL
jgi:hypothetical protein